MPTSLLRAGPLAADFVSGANRPTFAIRNGHRVAEFPSAGTTETYYTFNMPTVFAQGDISVKIQWMAKVAIINDAVWAVAFERHQNSVDDLDTDSFAADIVAAAETVPGTSGQTIETIIPVTAALYDGIVQGEQFRLRVRRLGDAAGDTLADIAQLMTVVIEQDAAPAGGGGGGFWTDGAGTRAGIGQGSPAPTAAGLEALAHGTSAYADGPNAFAMGPVARADKTNSWAFGNNAQARGADSLAFGANSRAGDGSPVEDDCIAIGRSADARGVVGVAVGKNSICRGNDSLAIGHYADAGGTGIGEGECIAIGPYAHADRRQAIAIGVRATATKNDQIVIGRDSTTYNGYRSISIGTGNSVGEGGFSGQESVTIGAYNTTIYEHGINIGTRNTTGFRDIMIGHNNPGSAADRASSFHNIIISTDNDNYQGSSNPGGSYCGSNTVIASGGSRGGLRPYPGIAQYANTIITAGRSYIYGRSHDNVVVGKNFDLNDYQEAVTEVYKNLLIGYGGRVGDFSAAGPNVCAYNTIVGYANYVWTNVTHSIIIGAGNNAKYNSSPYYNKNVTIGHYNYNWSGHSNVAMGAYCEIKDDTFVDPSGNNSRWSRGNFAIGYQCEIIKPPGTGGAFRSTMAQGCGAEVGVSGQRAFSDNVQHQTFVAGSNQGSFIVPKTETIDATQTTILTFPTLPDKAYALWGWIIARRTDVDGFNAAFSLSNTLAYRNAIGAPLLVGAPKAWVMDANLGAPGWTIDISIVVNDIVVRVTGTAAQTIEWLGWIQVIEVRG